VKAWTALTVALPASIEEEILLALHEAGTMGAEVAGAEPGTGDRRMWTAYFEKGTDLAPLLRELGGLPGAGPSRIRDFKEEPWVERQQAGRRPIAVGERFLIVSDGRDTDSQDRLALVVPAGRAFGTGEHETTRLCLEQLEKIPLPGLAVLDLGTGSGILAMAATRLGAGRVAAVDVDPDAAAVAHENLRLNGLGDGDGTLAIVNGDLSSFGGSFDLILANLYPQALERAASGLAARQPAGGKLVVSGFSAGEADSISVTFSRVGYRESSRSLCGEWAALLLERVGPRPSGK